MLITLISEKRMYSLRLPEKISGRFWIEDEDKPIGNNQLISIEANTSLQKWEIRESRTVHLFSEDGKTKLKEIKLESNCLYPIAYGKENQRGFLFTEDFTEDRSFYTKYVMQNNAILHIGKAEDNTIRINNPFVSSHHAQLQFQNGEWCIKENINTNGVYVNGIRIHKEQKLKPGDCIYIMGVKIITAQAILTLNNPHQSVSVITKDMKEFVLDYQNEEKDFELEEDHYYYRSPRFTRNISPFSLKVEAPTKRNDGDKTPIMLTLAPALLMGVASFASGIVAVNNTMKNGGDVVSSLPTLLMAVSMLCGMVLFPFIMKKRDKKQRKKDERLRCTRYEKYLERLHDEIRKEIRHQETVLQQSNLPIQQLVGNEEFWREKLWCKTKKDDDFLFCRVGSGTIEMNADIRFPEERFSIEEDILMEKMVSFEKEKNLLQMVPVGFSLLQDRVVGIVGEKKRTVQALTNIFLQLAALHSYDEVKLVFLCEKRDMHDFDYIRSLPHIWDDKAKVRYLANSEDDTKELNAVLQKIVNQYKEENECSCHYVFVTTSKSLADKTAVYSELLRDDSIPGFSIISVYDEVRNLPKECTKVIQIVGNKGVIFNKKMMGDDSLECVPDEIDSINVFQIARKIAGYQLDLQQGKYLLPGMLTFLEMFHVGKYEHLNIRQRWKENNPVMSLQTPVGVDTNGETFYLDLHEKFHGPHGLIAGMTGSGKSEFIITFILSLAVNYHPDEVAFVLIDYKGGGLAGAFANEHYRLPHLAGTITNLDGGAITRSILSIKSELRRRQAIFNKARTIANEGTMDIYKYQKMYRNGLVEEAIPHLFIISDEFAELKSQQPEFMEQLISTARIGRSLGVHLILATQKPSGVVNEQIWANSRFKVCLKVQDKNDSMDMLKRPDAAEIAETGRFYLQVGYNEIFELGQSAWCGAPYVESDQLENEYDEDIQMLDNLGNIVDEVRLRNTKTRISNGKQIVRVMEYICKTADEERARAKQLWLPEIPALIYVDSLRAKYAYHRKTVPSLCAMIGEFDDPYEQRQDILYHDFMENGNMLIFGATGSGKATMLTAILYSLYEDYTAEELNTYILDFGAETLRMYAGAPQTGDVVIEGDTDKVENLILLLNREMEKRKALFAESGGDFVTYQTSEHNSSLPAILVIIHNYTQFMENNEKFDDDINSITRECTKFGIYFVVTATASNGIRHRMIQNFNQIYTLRMNDKTEYISILGSTGGVYPSQIKGNGIYKKDETYIFQTAHLCDTQDGLHEYVKQFCKMLSEKTITKAKCIPVLPKKLTCEDIRTVPKTLQQIPVGVSAENFDYVNLDLQKNCVMHILSQDKSDYVPFAETLAEISPEIENCEVYVLDVTGKLRTTAERTHYINQAFDQEIVKLFNIVVTRHNDYKRTGGHPDTDIHPIMMIIPSFFQFRQALSADCQDKLNQMLEKSNGSYQLAYFILDDYQSSNRYSMDGWYTRQCAGEGIWIGDGVYDQLRMQLFRNRNEMSTKYVDSAYGYRIQRGKATFMKLVLNGEAQNE